MIKSLKLILLLSTFLIEISYKGFFLNSFEDALSSSICPSCNGLKDPDKIIDITDRIKFIKSKISLENVNLQDKYDIIFYDAFAPSKQPSIWQKKNLEKIYSHMNEDSILVTYCSSGQFKRDLKLIGFELDVLPGPKGKKEMVRAIK